MWGRHLICNASRCNRNIRDLRVIELFAADMVKRIDMKAWGPPRIEFFGEDNKAGFTLVQLIETSNITAHFCDSTGDAYIDVFSCRTFSDAVCQQVIQDWFQPHLIDIMVIGRQAGKKMVLE